MDESKKKNVGKVFLKALLECPMDEATAKTMAAHMQENNTPPIHIPVYAIEFEYLRRAAKQIMRNEP